MDKDMVIAKALECGFMVTSMCGEEEPKLMPCADADTLVKFAEMIKECE